jgi:hypothetical protein
MELNEFITKVLVDIAIGIKNANAQMDNSTFEMESYRRETKEGFIAFDIAVKSGEVKDKEGNAGIGIQVINLGIGGKVGTSSTQEQVNRIKFSVMPTRNIA